MLNDETLRRLANQVKTVIEGTDQVTAQVCYCETLVKDCLKNKTDLINVLSKHPNWDAENFRVHFDADYTREQDVFAAKCKLRELGSLITSTVADSDIPLWQIGYYLKQYAHEFCSCAGGISTDTEKCVKELTVGGVPIEEALGKQSIIKAGSKCTKAVMKLLRACDFENILPNDDGKENTENPAFSVPSTLQKARRLYAEYADAMNPIKITRHTVLSVNPVDFLLMSNGNSWQSCHEIYDDWGCYCGGCESYAYDTQTMIFFTVGADEDDVTWSGKETRQLYFFNGDVLLGSRVYPQDCDGDTGIYKEQRLIVEKIIADCLGVENVWKETDYTTVTAYNSYHYRDYDCAKYPAYRLSFNDDEIDSVLNIGTNHGQTICVCCGGYLDSNEYPVCKSCSGEEEFYCNICGEYHYERDTDRHYLESRGWDVCDYCWENYVQYCEKCGDYFYEEDGRYIEGYGFVCDDCLEANDDEFAECSHCGNMHLVGDMVEVDGQYLCDYCLSSQTAEAVDDNYNRHFKSWMEFIEETGEWYFNPENDPTLVKCSACGKWHHLNIDADLRYIDNEYLCPSCTSKAFDTANYFRCDECGQYKPIWNRTIIDGEEVCSRCSSLIVYDCITGEPHLSKNLYPRRIFRSNNDWDYIDGWVSEEFKDVELVALRFLANKVVPRDTAIAMPDGYFYTDDMLFEDELTGELQPERNMYYANVKKADGTEFNNIKTTVETLKALGYVWSYEIMRYEEREVA